MNLITYDEFKEKCNKKPITIKYEGYDFHDISRVNMIEILEEIVKEIIKKAELGYADNFHYFVGDLDDKFVLILQALFLNKDYHTELKGNTLVINWDESATQYAYFFLENDDNVKDFLDIIPYRDEIVRYVTPQGRLNIKNEMEHSINEHLLKVIKHEKDDSLKYTSFRYIINRLNERIVYILQIIANKVVKNYQSLGFNISYIYDTESSWVSYQHIFRFHFDLTSKYVDKDEPND